MIHKEKYLSKLLKLSKYYLFQVFHKFIYPEIYHKFHHKHQKDLFKILNLSKLNTSVKNIHSENNKRKKNCLLNFYCEVTS